MRPSHIERRVIPVPAGISWTATLQHRVYSCPDTLAFDFVYGATCLLLKHGNAGNRISLNVEAVETCNPHAPNYLDSVPPKFRARLSDYVTSVRELPPVLEGQCSHRFYFLSHEPWPGWLQDLTSPEQCSDLEWKAVLSVMSVADQFFVWPQVGALLWPGCIRNTETHIYPEEIARRLAQLRVECDPRNNGPAIAAFLAAGGTRPRHGREGWPIHHIYDGTVPFAPDAVSVQAVNNGRYFTHSAGLVAAHPVAHHLAHQSPLLKWLLRREAYIRFGFDPDGAFNH